MPSVPVLKLACAGAVGLEGDGAGVPGVGFLLSVDQSHHHTRHRQTHRRQSPGGHLPLTPPPPV